MANNDSLYLQLQNDEFARRHTPAIAFIASIMVIGLVGNTVVCYIYLLRFKPSPTRFFILISAALDILNCLISMPLKIYGLRFHATFGGSPVCWLSAMAAIFCAFSGSTVQLVIAVERYKKICRPFQKQMTVFTAKIATGISLFLVFLSTLPTPYIRLPTTIDLGNVNGSFCWYPSDQAPTIRRSFSGFHISYFTLILLSLILLYTCIWYRVYRQSNWRGGQSPASPNVSYNIRSETSDVVHVEDHTEDSHASLDCVVTEGASETGDNTTKEEPSVLYGVKVKILNTRPITSKRDKKDTLQNKAVINTTLTMFMVTLMIMLSYIPYFIESGIAAKNGNENFPDLNDFHFAVITICGKSYFLHSALNPIIYMIFNANFRQELTRLTCKNRANVQGTVNKSS